VWCGKAGGLCHCVGWFGDEKLGNARNLFVEIHRTVSGVLWDGRMNKLVDWGSLMQAVTVAQFQVWSTTSRSRL
jgi:hypothetical protein